MVIQVLTDPTVPVGAFYDMKTDNFQVICLSLFLLPTSVSGVEKGLETLPSQSPGCGAIVFSAVFAAFWSLWLHRSADKGMFHGQSKLNLTDFGEVDIDQWEQLIVMGLEEK